MRIFADLFLFNSSITLLLVSADVCDLSCLTVSLVQSGRIQKEVLGLPNPVLAT